MSKVTEIETAIRRLSVDEQRTIALHLGERLADENYAARWGASDEGIRFLPQQEFGEIAQALKSRAFAKAAR